MEKCETVKEKVESQNTSRESFNNAPSTPSTPDEGAGEMPSTWAVMKRHRVAVLWSAFVAIAAINWGMDALMSTSTISIATFERDFGYEFKGSYIISSRWQIGFNSASYIGQFFGAIISGNMADRFGKRHTLGGACVLSIAAVFVQVFARSSAVLLIGKLLNGVTLGTFLTIPSSYAAEICPVEIRGLTTSGVQLLISIGQLAANLVIKGTGTLDSALAYKIPFALQFVFPVILLLGLPFCPESPWFLLRRSDTDGTLATLARLGYLCPVTVLAEMSSIITHESKHASTTSYLDCFRGSHRRRTEIAMGVFAAAQATGVVFALGYSSYFFELAGLSNSNAFTLSVGVTILGLFGVVCSWFLINRRGRRSTSLIGVALLTFLTLLIGILDILPNYSSKGPVYGQVACIIVFAFVYLCTIGPMGWALFAEIPSSALRSRTVGLGVVVQSLFGILLNIVVPLLINPDAADLGGKIGFIFAGTSALGTLWIWLRVPETAGRSFEELDWLFDQGVPARRFKDFVVPS
ncbi:maltose permease protein [Rutstroemia sp. NJR-2017a BBW]|nr:maltose permease protein [Rutstroemia sp. NJR-2017a BBW]